MLAKNLPMLSALSVILIGTYDQKHTKDLNLTNTILLKTSRLMLNSVSKNSKG